MAKEEIEQKSVEAVREAFDPGPGSVTQTESRRGFTGEGVHVFIMRPNGASTPAGPAASVGGAHELANALGLKSEDVWVTWGYEPARISLASNCPLAGQLSLALAEVR